MASPRAPGPAQAYLRGRVLDLATSTSRATAEPLAAWATRRIRLDGRPFSFEGHDYLKAIYDDGSPHVVLCKAAQIGGTVWALLRAIHACLNSLNVIYFFPTRSDVLEFSKSRVGPLIEENTFLARQMRDTDTAGLKRFGAAHLYFRGMQSPVGMKSVPADMVIFDELDEATPDAKTRAKERLSHSAYRRQIELSNPSLPNFGIDEVFQRSDQRHWTIRCGACTAWTAIDVEFPTKAGQEVRVIRKGRDGTHFRACPKCGAELDLREGEWVATYPDRPIHGYRISQLHSPVVDPGEILQEYRTTRFLDRFYNLKIGIPWADAQNRVDKPMVLSCCGSGGLLDRSPTPCTMGVDTGKQLHVVISRYKPDGSGKREVVYLGAHEHFDELDDLIARFRVRRCVIDAMPEIHATRAFAARHRGRVWLNFFQENQRGSYLWDREQGIVRENRTEALDASRKVIRDGRLLLPRQNRLVEEFAEHVANDAKRLEEDEETGAQVYRYKKLGVNHFSFAWTYDCIAWSRERYGDSGVRIGIVPTRGIPIGPW
jgi:hypothetical protein